MKNRKAFAPLVQAFRLIDLWTENQKCMQFGLSKLFYVRWPVPARQPQLTWFKGENTSHTSLHRNQTTQRLWLASTLQKRAYPEKSKRFRAWPKRGNCAEEFNISAQRRSNFCTEFHGRRHTQKSLTGRNRYVRAVRVCAARALEHRWFHLELAISTPPIMEKTY